MPEMIATMGVLYALVADENRAIVCECSRAKQGTVSLNAQRVLTSIPTRNIDKQSYCWNDHSYDCIFDSRGYCFMVVTSEGYNRVRTFQLLAELKDKYSTGGRSPAAFRPELNALCAIYSDPNSTKMLQVRDDMGGVKDVMITNMERVLDRGDAVDVLIGKTKKLDESAKIFQERAKKLRCIMMCKKIMIICFTIFILLLIIFIVMLFLCSKDGLNFDKCFGSSDKKK